MSSLSQDLSIIAQNLNRLRRIKKISQKEIADYIGVIPGTFSRWESKNFSNIKYESMIKIVEYFENKGVIFQDFSESNMGGANRNI